MKNGFLDCKKSVLAVLMALLLLTGVFAVQGAPVAMATDSSTPEGETEEIFERDGSKIEGIDLFWLTPDSAVDNEGNAVSDTEKNDDGSARHDHLYIATKSNAELKMTYQFEVGFSGQYDYAPGDIQITIPAQVWHGRDSSDMQDGKVDFSSLIGDLDLSVPQAPSTKGDFNWQLINGQYVLTNTKTIGATSKAMFQMSLIDLYPSKIVDMSECDPITVHVEVVTNKGNLISRTSDPIVAQVDTCAQIVSAKKATNNELYEERPAQLPAKLLSNLPAGTAEEDYIYVRWYSYVYHQGNQPFSIDIGDKLSAAYKVTENGEEKVTDGIFLGCTNVDGTVLSGEEYDFEGNVWKNRYCADTTSSYDHTVYMWSAYKKDDFYVPTAKEPPVTYVMRNHIDWTLTEYDALVEDPGYDKPEDEKKVTTASADAVIHYAPIRWSRPTGRFEVFKYTEYDSYKDWNYGYGLNRLIDGEDVSMRFLINSVGFGYPWTSHRTNPDDPLFVGEDEISQEDFGQLGWRQTIEDFQTFFDNTDTVLTARDFETTWLEVRDPELLRYRKSAAGEMGYKPDGDALTADRVVYGMVGAGQYGYFRDRTLPKPDIRIEYQVNGEDVWLPAAVGTWGETGKGAFSFVDVQDGIKTSGRKVYFPENTTDVRHIFVSNVFGGKSAELCDTAAIFWDVYLGIDLKASAENIAIAENWFTITDTPSTKFRNDVRMVVDGWVPAKADGTPDTGVRLQVGENSFYDVSRATISGASYGVSLSKSVDFSSKSTAQGGDNDVENRRATLHYSAVVHEKSNLSNRQDYDDAVASGVIPAETAGVWYDLLPEGVIPLMDTVKLRRNDTITNIYIKENYQNTGRILLVVECDLTPAPALGSGNVYQDSPTIEFDAIYPWEAIDDYGKRAVNYIAFESKAQNLRYDTLGTITGQRGEADDPRTGNNTLTPQMPDVIADAMTDLDKKTDDNRFLYGKCEVMLDVNTSAVSGIAKVVKNDLNGIWTQGLDGQDQVTVYEGHHYTYRLRVVSSESTTTRDIVIYDTIENYHIPDPQDDTTMDATKAEDYADKESKKNWQGAWEGIGQWRGTLERVDISEFLKKDVAPVLYYSLVPDLTFADSSYGSSQDGRLELFASGAYNLNDSKIWTRVELDETGVWTVPESLYGKVTAVALDARKTIDGQSFVLQPGASLSGYLHMKAPDDNRDPDSWIAKGAYAHKTDAEGNPIQEVDWEKAIDEKNNMYAFNNTRLKCVQSEVGAEDSSSDLMIRNDYTRVGILPQVIGVTKTWKDQNNHDNLRPESVTLTLMRKLPGEEYQTVKDEQGQPLTVTLSEENNWLEYLEQIDVVNEEGIPYSYTFVEEDVPGYTYTVDKLDRIMYRVSNVHPNEQVELKGEKQWNDEDNANNHRPKSITLSLLRDGVFVKKITVYPDAEGNWTYSFGKLDRYEDGGREYVYEVQEEYVPKYVSSAEGYQLVVNDYHPFGDLSVQKHLVGATEVAAENEFEFTVKLLAELTEEQKAAGEEPVPLMDEYDYEVFQLTADGQEWEETGITGKISCSGTFVLKGDQKVVIYQLPSESTYEIVEAERDGFRLTDVHNSSGTIRAGQLAEAEFTNTYTARGQVQLNAIKYQTGHALRKSQHRFQVMDMNEGSENYGKVVSTAYSGTPVNQQDENGVITGEAVAAFGQIMYSQADHGKTFVYEVSEVNVGKPGYTYDDTKYTVYVTVRDNGDGTMTVTAVDENGKDVTLPTGENMPFDNEYEASGEITLKAWKSLPKRELKENEFTFELYHFDEETGETGELIASVKNDAEGNVTFPAFSFDQDDVSLDDNNPAKYVYLVKEKYGSDRSVIYSQQVYKYEITVYDNHDGTLSFVEGTQAGSRELLDCEACGGNGSTGGKAHTLLNVFPMTNEDGEPTYGYSPYNMGTPSVYVDGQQMINNVDNVQQWHPNLTSSSFLNGIFHNILGGTYSCDVYCPMCAGSGKVGDIICDVCKGSGYDASSVITGIYNEQLGSAGAPINLELVDYVTPDELLVYPGVPLTDISPDAKRGYAVFEWTNSPYDNINLCAFQTCQNGWDPGLEAIMINFFLSDPQCVNETLMTEEEYYTLTAKGGDEYALDTNEEVAALYWYLMTGSYEPTEECNMKDGEECDVCGGTGKVEGAMKVDGAQSMPVFENDIHDGHLSVTKQVTNNPNPYPDQEFNFVVRLTGEVAGELEYELVPAAQSGANGSDEDSTVDGIDGQSSTKYYLPEEEEEAEPFAVFDDNTKTLTFFRMKKNAQGVYEYGDLKLDESDLVAAYEYDSYKDTENSREYYRLTKFETKDFSATDFPNWPWASYKREKLVHVKMEGGFKPKTCSNLFSYCWVLKDADLSMLDTSNSNSMYETFRDSWVLEELDLSTLDTSNVTNFYKCFAYSKKLKKLTQDFDTSKATNMYRMFEYCESLEHLDVSGFDTSNVENFSGMFDYCTKIDELDVSGFDTGKGKEFYGMFYNVNVPVLDLRNFDFSSTNSNGLQNLFNTSNASFGCEVILGDAFVNNDNLQMTLSSYAPVRFSRITLPAGKCIFAAPKNAKIPTYSNIYTGNWVNVDTGEVIEDTADKSALQILLASGMGGTWEWELAGYQVSFDAGEGGAGVMMPAASTVGSSLTVQNKFYQYGKDLEGFTDGKGNTFEVTEDGKITIPANTYQTGDKIVLTAQWKYKEGSVEVTEDTFAFTLRAGDTITFKDITAYTAYEVWEETPEGWVLVAKENDVGQIKPLVTSKAVFANKYDPSKASVQLRAVKLMDGKGAQKDAFTFTLSEGGTEVEAVQNMAGGTVQFAPIEYDLDDKDKTYTYVIREKAGDDSIITYDTREYKAIVKVKDNGKGVLTAVVDYQTDDGQPPVFENETKPGGLSVSKQISGATPIATQQEFTVEVTFTDADFKPWTGIDGMVNVEGGEPIELIDGKATLTLMGGDTVILTDIPAGIRYEARETGSLPGWTMDGTVKEGKIQATVTDEITFENTYAAKGHAAPEAIKVLEGRTIKEGEFTFGLYDADGNLIDTATTEAVTGKVVFNEITYTEPALYFYTIKEIIPDERDEAVEYSEEVINVTITVTDEEGKGRLTHAIGYTMNGTEGNTITNKIKPGALKISKTVVSSIAAHKEKEFAFTLYLTDAAGQLLSGEYAMSNGDTLMVESGSGTLTLKDGETVTVEGLPDGASYSVVEAAEGGFTQKSSGTTGKIRANQTAAAAFTNTYHAEGEYVFEGVKVLEGKTLEADQFVFELYDSEGYVLESVTNDAEGKFAFKKLMYTEADVGEKTYTISEKNTAMPGVTYDETRYEIKLIIRDNGDGTLTVEAAGLPAAGMTFENTYSNETEITVTKQWKGDEENTDARRDITVNLYSKAGSGEKQLVDSVIIPADAEGEELTVKWDKLPVFEVQDGKAVEIEYSVTETMAYGADEKNPYMSTVMGSAREGFTLVNRYGYASVQIEARKDLLGRELAEGQFTFQITDDEGNVVSTAVNNADGTVLFPVFEYTMADILDAPMEADGTRTKNVNLKLEEVNDGQPGYTYDDWYQKFAITLHLDVNGKLTAKCNMTAEETIFRNTYEAEGKVQFEGVKTLTGRDLEEGQFSFTLTGEDVEETVKNDKDGNFTFSEITYDETMLGEHTYTVTEVNGGKAGYTYDDTEYEIIVNVADNGNGTLSVTYTVNGETDTEIAFENEYAAEGSVQFEGVKTLTGRDLEEGQFSFSLIGETFGQTVKNDKDGKFVFTEITYDETMLGDHTYTVTEVNDGKAGYTYSEAEYEIVVTVEDNGDGTLDVSYTVNGEENGAITFENEYKAEGKVQFSGTKTLTGRDLAEGQFSFTLTGEEVNETVTNDKDGKFSFTEITYDETMLGDHSYTVTEVNDGKAGYTYDDAEYEIIVNVEDNGDGTLDVTYTVNGEEDTEILFANEYAADATITISGEKTVGGEAPEDDEVFTFQLKDADGKVLQEVENTGSSITFAEIPYTLADAGKTYTYTIQESTESNEQYLTDDSVYTVQVALTDKGDGTLNIEWTLEKDGEAAEKIAFDNTPLSHLDIEKKVIGRAGDQEKLFAFKVTLTDEEGKELKGTFPVEGANVTSIESGSYLHLKHGEKATVKCLPVGTKYAVEEDEYTAFETEAQNAEGEITEEGSKAEFVNTLKTVSFSVTKEWQGGDNGLITLTLYENGKKMEPQPTYAEENNVYSYTNLPQYTEEGKAIVYAAKEKYMDGYMTIYRNIAPYAQETDMIYNGGTIVNKAVTSFHVQKVWEGLAEDEEAPAITLTLYCNGEALDKKTPAPNEDGWYIWHNLPLTYKGEAAEYTVAEEPVEGFTVSYGEAAEGEEEPTCARDYGTIVNRKIPKTGDESRIGLWIGLSAVSACAFILLMKKRKEA